jgi:hypothetical protein
MSQKNLVFAEPFESIDKLDRLTLLTWVKNSSVIEFFARFKFRESLLGYINPALDAAMDRILNRSTPESEKSELKIKLYNALILIYSWQTDDYNYSDRVKCGKKFCNPELTTRLFRFKKMAPELFPGKAENAMVRLESNLSNSSANSLGTNAAPKAFSHVLVPIITIPPEVPVQAFHS